MRRGIHFAIFAIVWTVSLPAARAQVYVDIEAGVTSRDIVEEAEELQVLQSGSVVGVGKFSGDASSTRLGVKIGYEFGRTLDLYVLGGGADLAVSEFDDYDAAVGPLLGGGFRINLYQSGRRDKFSLFVEGSALRFTTEDNTAVLEQCITAHGCPVNDGLDYFRFADEEIEWNEYTVKLGASSGYGGSYFYGGARLSMVRGTDRIVAPPDANFTETLDVKLDIEEEDNFGVFFGVLFYLDRAETTGVRLEGSLIDQDSFFVGIQRRF